MSNLVDERKHWVFKYIMKLSYKALRFMDFELNLNKNIWISKKSIIKLNLRGESHYKLELHISN